MVGSMVIGKAPSNEWIDQITQFLNHAFSILGLAENDSIKWLVPCAATNLGTKHLLWSCTCVSMALMKAMKHGGAW